MARPGQGDEIMLTRTGQAARTIIISDYDRLVRREIIKENKKKNSPVMIDRTRVAINRTEPELLV